jgi:hypothetical protein
VKKNFKAKIKITILRNGNEELNETFALKEKNEFTTKYKYKKNKKKKMRLLNILKSLCLIEKNK